MFFRIIFLTLMMSVLATSPVFAQDPETAPVADAVKEPVKHVKPAVKPAPVYSHQQVIMGWVEYVVIDELNAKLKAKLDSGATTSSLRAEVLKIVKGKKKGDKRRVIFQVEDNDGKVSTLERKLIRWVRIKSRTGTGYMRRPVVDMDFCVAGHRVHAEVNLAPRADFIYPILIGRNMLRDGHMLVDSNKTFTAKPYCPAVEPKEE